MKMISIVTGCYNESENVSELIRRVREVMAKVSGYTYEHIFIDNCSEDRTVAILKEFAQDDRRIRIIVNTRNFGHIRSPYYAILQGEGAAVISLEADLQDPPELILTLIKKWEVGFTNYTKIPLRLATLLGFLTALLSLLVGVGYLVAKLLFWDAFTAGVAPLLIGIFFIGSIQLFFLGVVGEYVGAVFTYVQNRPLVVEKERVNFEDKSDGSIGRRLT